MLKQMLEKLVAGIAIGVFGAVALFARVGDQPRLWDVLSDRLAPPSSSQNGPNVIWVDSQRPTTRMMVTNDSSFAPVAGGVGAPAAPSRAQAAAAPAAPAKNSWMKHISGMLAMFSVEGPATQHSSASASVASAAPDASGSAPAAALPASTLAAVAKAPVADATSSSYVSYGGGTRSDIMSSASGPVYNFSGRKK